MGRCKNNTLHWEPSNSGRPPPPLLIVRFMPYYFRRSTPLYYRHVKFYGQCPFRIALKIDYSPARRLEFYRRNLALFARQGVSPLTPYTRIRLPHPDDQTISTRLLYQPPPYDSHPEESLMAGAAIIYLRAAPPPLDSRGSRRNTCR